MKWDTTIPSYMTKVIKEPETATLTPAIRGKLFEPGDFDPADAFCYRCRRTDGVYRPLFPTGRWTCYHCEE